MNHNYLAALIILCAVAFLYVPAAYADVTTTITSTVTVTTTITTTTTITFNTTYTATFTTIQSLTQTVTSTLTPTTYATPTTTTTTITSTTSALATTTTSTTTVATTTESHSSLTVSTTATLDSNNGVTSSDRSIVNNGIWTYGFFANYSNSGDTFYYRTSNDSIHFTDTHQISSNLIRGFSVYYIPNTTMVYVAYADNYIFGGWRPVVKNYTTNVDGSLIEPATQYNGATIPAQSSSNDHTAFSFAQTENYIYLMVNYAADANSDGNPEEHIRLYRAPINTTAFTLVTEQIPPCYPDGFCQVQNPDTITIVPISDHVDSVLFAKFRETALSDFSTIANRTILWWVYYGDNSTLKSFSYQIGTNIFPYTGFGFFDHVYLSQHGNMTYAMLDTSYDWNYRVYKINSANNITCAITATNCAVSTGNNADLYEPYHSFGFYAYSDYLNIFWLKKVSAQNLTNLMLDTYDYNGTRISSHAIYNFNGGNFDCGYCFVPQDPERISGVQDGYNRLILTVFLETATNVDPQPSGRLLVTYISGAALPPSNNTVTISFSYSVTCGVAGGGAPVLFYTLNGLPQTYTLTTTPTLITMDRGTTWHVTNPWFTNLRNFYANVVSGIASVSGTTVNIQYSSCVSTCTSSDPFILLLAGCFFGMWYFTWYGVIGNFGVGLIFSAIAIALYLNNENPMSALLVFLIMGGIFTVILPALFLPLGAIFLAIGIAGSLYQAIRG